MESSTYITSDLHFGHKRILEFAQEFRQYHNVEEMNEDLISRWNEVVCPEDTIYNLGDLCFYYNKEKVKNIIRRLNGKHHLILGNHDQALREFYSGIKDEIKDDGNRFFEEVVDYKEIKHGGHKLVLMHYPIQEWNGMHHGSIHLYGHLHDRAVPSDGVYRICNVGYDRFGHILELDTLVCELSKLEIKERISE